jgi:hypothetical protein
MASDDRRWLKRSVTTILLPAFQQMGFTSLPLKGALGREQSVRNHFLFGELRRAGPDGDELVQLELMPKQRAALRITFGIVPATGIDSVSGHIPADEVLACWLPLYYELCPNPRRMWYFLIARLPGKTIDQEAYNEMVRAIVSILPQVDVALRSGKCEEYVRIVDLRPRELGRVRKIIKGIRQLFHA